MTETEQDIFGHVVEFSRDQNGSRLIQQQLEEADEDDRQKVFEEVFPEKTDMLIQDVFGNYVRYARLCLTKSFNDIDLDRLFRSFSN